jgi:ferredoxin
MSETLPDPAPFIVLGVRPCDAKALTQYDMVFGGDTKDPYYWARRDKGVLVGLGCATPPSPNCFCPTVGGSPHSTDGLDILLTDLGTGYYVESLTKKGEKLLEPAKTLFKAPTAQDKQAKEKVAQEAEKKIRRRVKNLAEVPPKLKGMFESELWDQEAMSCLRCGICTYLCPTCHCFDISDEVKNAGSVQGERVRTWDTCQFPDFTMHSSGHNPRPHKASRLRQRIFHKFQYFVENYQTYQCTGCGRCISLCPVGIDIIEVLNKVRDHA